MEKTLQARLVLEAGDGEPTELELEPGDAISMGRSRDNTIVLRDEHASRLHARIFFLEGQWHVQDFSLNGTLVNNERITQKSPLQHGQEIRIGNVRLRFNLQDPMASSQFRLSTSTNIRERNTTNAPSTARLHLDETAILCHFMTGAVAQTDPWALVRSALQLALNQSNCYVAGFLSPDAAEPRPKLVLPESAGIDPSMSRQLTRRVQRDGKTAWLGTNLTDSRPSDSMREVTDALCVPVRGDGKVLGMLHLYQKGQFFSERSVRFTEALAEFLGGCLQRLHTERKLQLQAAFLRTHPLIVDELVGDSAAMVNLRQQIAHAATQPFPILVRGEPGVGTELIAWNLHLQSARADGPLVAVPCLGIAPTLLEAEIFGKRQNSRSPDVPACCCTKADEGTLFFDEITALPPECQQRLFRLIEEKCFRPLGGLNEIPLDARVIAATQCDLQTAIGDGQFRPNLYQRLSTITIDVPPLRAHLEDIPYLVQYFLDKLAMESRKDVTLTDAAMKKLRKYSWPGNMRQLRAELESAVLRSTGAVIDEEHVLQGCERLLVSRTSR
jgi:Nif-specific regulatory protein